MRKSFLHMTCVAAIALAGAGWAHPATAQEAQAGSGDTQAGSANAQVGSDDTAEIIVTAQKRKEKLQSIPVAASVLTADKIEQAHVLDLSDINRVVPSVEIKGTFNGRVPYGLRGISTNANEAAIGLTSGVSIQVDGVPVPADSFAANTISDIAQLEVLKGPQATLGGRTASAGVINFVTNGPSRTLEGAFTGLVTDDGEYRAEGRIAGPISRNVSFSLSAYGSRTPYPIKNLTRDEKSRADSYGLRGKLKFEPTDNFDITLMGHYALSKSRGENFVPQYFTPGAALFPFIPSEFNGPGGSPSFFGIRQSVAFPGYTIKYGNTKYASPVAMRSRYEDTDGSVTLNYRTGDLTLSSLTSYFREKQFQSQDIFESNVYFFDVLLAGVGVPPAAIPHFGNVQTADGTVKQFTQEFKVVSDPSNPINFVAGLFYSDMNVDQTNMRVWVANPQSKRNISVTKNYAAYARVTAKLTHSLRAVAGLRYNHDKISWTLDQFFDPAAGQFEGCLFNGLTGAGAFPCKWSLKDSSNALVGDIALQADLGRNVMVYASYTRGYKPKAFNTAHDFSSLQSAPNAADLTFTNATAQEHINSFELGMKSSLLDRHLTFNLAAFYTKYNGYQAQIFDNSALIGLLVLANAGARTQGIEADLNYVKHNTRLSLSGAYIDAKFTNFANATCYPTQTVAQGCVNGAQDLSGHPLPDSPKFKLNASAEQTIPFSAFNLILGGNLSARSSAILQADGNPQTRQRGFALLDASIGFQTKNERATLTFFVNNITNHFYLTNAEDFFSAATGTAAVPSGVVTLGNYVIGQPARDARRYFGGRLNVKF